MRRVTRATSRAEAEFNNVSDTNHSNYAKCDLKESNSKPDDILDENNSAVAANSSEGLKNIESQNQKSNDWPKGKKATTKRQPLGDIALNAVNDDSEKRKVTRADRRSGGGDVDTETGEASLVVDSEIHVDEEQNMNMEVYNNEGELAATELMEPSILDVVQEVDEIAVEKDEDAERTSCVENVVESSGASKYYQANWEIIFNNPPLHSFFSNKYPLRKLTFVFRIRLFKQSGAAFKSYA